MRVRSPRDLLDRAEQDLLANLNDKGVTGTP